MISAEFDERGTTLIAEIVDMALHKDTEQRVKGQLLLGLARFVWPALASMTVKSEDAPQTAFVLNLAAEKIEVKPQKSADVTDVIDENDANFP